MIPDLQAPTDIGVHWGRAGIFLDVPNWETGLHDWREKSSDPSRPEDGGLPARELLSRSIRGIQRVVASHGRVVMARAYGRCYLANGGSSPPKGPTAGLVAADRAGFVTVARFVQSSESNKPEDIDMPLYRDVAGAVYRDRLDTAVVVSGDGDMAYVAETVKECGKRFVTLFWSSSGSKRLLSIADDVLELGATARAESLADLIGQVIAP